MEKNEMIREKICKCDLDEAKAQIIEAFQIILVAEISKQTKISKKRLKQFFGENTENTFLHMRIDRTIKMFIIKSTHIKDIHA